MRKRMIKRMVALAVAAMTIGAAGCGEEDSSSETGPTSSRSEAGPDRDSTLAAEKSRPASGATIKTAPSQFGKVLFSGSDRAIYYFDKESTSKPECYGECARAWPPVLTKGKPQAAGRVKQGLLGTRKRANGKRQVTYDGHPLYFYVDDP
jgi:predicted lipoprotein with Yx(FWY)xxD motif